MKILGKRIIARWMGRYLDEKRTVRISVSPRKIPHIHIGEYRMPSWPPIRGKIISVEFWYWWGFVKIENYK